MNGILDAIGGPLLEVVLPALATIIGGFLVRLLNTQLKKAGIELDHAQQEQVKVLIQDAIRATEEAARRRPLTGTEKRAMTITAVHEAAPDLPHDTVQAAVDAQLQVVRAQDSPSGLTITPAVPVTVDAR